MLRTAALTAAFLASSVLAPAPKPNYKPPEGPNKNTLITKHKDKIKVAASSSYSGYPVDKLIDGDTGTSWFSGSNDSVGKGKMPWVEVEFPEDVTVARVNLLGNRDKDYPKGYSILAGKIEFMDKDGKKLHEEEGKAMGDLKDFEFTPKKAVAGVRRVRFTSTKDEGDINGSGDVALAEIQIE